NIIILVQGDVDINKNFVTLVNGGGANYIFLETLGNGSTASGNSFTMAGGSTADSRWLGTVWAPNGSINFATGTKALSSTGAFFTNNTINIASNVTMDYAPYIDTKNGNNPLIVPAFPPPGKVEGVLGPQLTFLKNNPPSGTVTYEDSVFRVINSEVLIDIVVI